MNNFWHHDVLRTEPSTANSAGLGSVKHFLEEFEDLDSLWQNLEERDFHPLGFRLPDNSSKPINSLGKANLIALYAEFSENNEPTGLILGYDDEALTNDAIAMPAVTAIVDNEKYGDFSGYDNQVELPVSTLPDLYGIGLARQFLDPDFNPDEGSNLYIPDSALDGVGKELQEKYSFDEKYEFFKLQGELIDEAHTHSIVTEALENAEENYEVE